MLKCLWLITQVPYERANIREYEYHSEMVPLQLKPYDSTKELKDANNCHNANHSMFSPISFSVPYYHSSFQGLVLTVWCAAAYAPAHQTASYTE